MTIGMEYGRYITAEEPWELEYSFARSRRPGGHGEICCSGNQLLRVGTPPSMGNGFPGGPELAQLLPTRRIPDAHRTAYTGRGHQAPVRAGFHVAHAASMDKRHADLSITTTPTPSSPVAACGEDQVPISADGEISYRSAVTAEYRELLTLSRRPQPSGFIGRRRGYYRVTGRKRDVCQWSLMTGQQSLIRISRYCGSQKSCVLSRRCESARLERAQSGKARIRGQGSIRAHRQRLRVRPGALRECVAPNQICDYRQRQEDRRGA
jgi:hypothetical protein